MQVQKKYSVVYYITRAIWKILRFLNSDKIPQINSINKIAL